MTSDGNQQTTLNMERTRLRLRSDLVFSPQMHRGATYYQLESPEAKFYRLGYAGYVFVSLLDGQTTFSEALAVSAQELGSKALSTQEATTIYLWLLENGLGSLENDSGSVPVGSLPPTKPGQNALPNPFWIRLPLGNPDRLIMRLVPYLGFLFSPMVTILATLFIASAVISVLTQLDQFASASAIVFSPRNWLWMTVAWLLLKIIHELAHAICCRRYGGAVHETGIVFVLFAPLAYVDASTSWRFPSKWSRIHVAAAGIYAELLVAAVAVFAWQSAETKFASHMLYNLIFMASASTLLFNANPLMRFDGYFILSDLLEIPNLYSEAQRVFRAQWTRILFGGRAHMSERSRMAIFIAGYGWAAASWRVVVFVSLSIAASVLFYGAGLALALGAIALWGLKSCKQTVVALRDRWRVNPLQVLRAAAVVGGLSFLAAAIWLWIPSPVAVSAPGVIEFVREENLRTPTGGFVEAVEVRDGQQVCTGDVLVRLRNPKVSNAYHDLQLSIEQMQVRYQTALESHDTAAAIVAKREIRALDEQLAEATVQFNSLTIRSPIEGTVIKRSIQHLVGTYAPEGQPLLTVVGDQRKELRLSLGQSDFDSAIPRVGGPVVIRVGSLNRLTGTLTRLEPRASTELSHPALSATQGGPLEVVNSETNESGRAVPELAEPRFRAIVAIADGHADIFSGQVATAYVGFRNESIGVSIYRAISDWLTTKLAAAAS